VTCGTPPSRRLNVQASRLRVAGVLCMLLLVLAGACKKKNETAANIAAANKVSVRPVRLYYESPEMLLAAETRSIALPESPAAAIPIVARELLKNPSPTSGLARIFPADTQLRGAYLLPGGTVIVDVGGSTLTQGWGGGSHSELMAVCSLVQSLTMNFREAQRVRIVLNGSSTETLGGHISLAHSLPPPAPARDPCIALTKR